jgi:hypothetical protein
MNEKQKVDDALEVGTWLGRRQAFSIVAGRCSAADAQSLRELRESKKYKELGLTWEDCCKQHAGIARSSAELIIRNLEEFGPDYFVIAQVTGISANDYRRIQGSVRNHALIHGGEEIPLQVENAQRLAIAVDTLRRETAATPAEPADAAAEAARSFAKAERAVRTALAEFDKLRSMPLDQDGRTRLQGVIDETTGALKLIGLQVEV